MDDVEDLHLKTVWTRAILLRVIFAAFAEGQQITQNEIADLTPLSLITIKRNTRQVKEYCLGLIMRMKKTKSLPFKRDPDLDFDYKTEILLNCATSLILKNIIPTRKLLAKLTGGSLSWVDQAFTNKGIKQEVSRRAFYAICKTYWDNEAKQAQESAKTGSQIKTIEKIRSERASLKYE